MGRFPFFYNILIHLSMRSYYADENKQIVLTYFFHHNYFIEKYKL